MKEEPRRDEVEDPVRRSNLRAVALIVGAVLLLVVVAFAARRGNPDQDKLTNTRTISTGQPKNPSKACASSATYDLIKREIFRRAAQLRGSDQAAFDRLSAVAVVRMDNPVMESVGSAATINCSGSLSLDLPPGVAVVGGRRTLSADIEYSIATAADLTGPVVLLRNADAIIAPLATLAQVNQAQAQAPSSGTNSELTPLAVPAVPQPASPTQLGPANQKAALRPSNSSPSFDCSTARAPGQVTVCNDPGLAALDRQMAAQYSRALALASPDQRDLLRDTARRFQAFRDQCSTSSCVSDAYSGRMREIQDIIEDRWQPPR